jgi:hypothetical protein
MKLKLRLHICQEFNEISRLGEMFQQHLLDDFIIFLIRQKLGPPTSYTSVFIGKRTICILLQLKNSLLTARTFCQMYFGLSTSNRKKHKKLLDFIFFCVCVQLFIWYSQENHFFPYLLLKWGFSDAYLIITEILWYFTILLDFGYT